MIRRPPRSTPFPTRRSSDLIRFKAPFNGDKHVPSYAPQCNLTIYDAKTRFVLWTMLEPERSFPQGDRKSTRLNSSHSQISYAVFCLKKKKNEDIEIR